MRHLHLLVEGSTIPDGPPVTRVEYVEAELAAAVGDPRFRPHLVLHEFEAWVFAARSALADHLGSYQLGVELDKVVAAAGGPEMVDDGPATSPSRRLVALYPGYVKAEDGPAAIERAGIDVLRDQCPHARAWIDSLLG